MRRFHSYGPINNKIHYYAPRENLINLAYNRLVGDNPDQGGHYITVWAPRQCGKTWVMLEVLERLLQRQEFDVVSIALEHLKNVKDISRITSSISKEISRELGKEVPTVNTLEDFQEIFSNEVLDKPLILILDEFDALSEEAINAVVSIFRNIYMHRQKELKKSQKPQAKMRYMLHALALIGVRSVLGIENRSGSPFNVQRSVHIPNLTYDEVTEMFRWYKKDTGQEIDDIVIEQLYNNTRGQPGLTGWFGELLTETYNTQPGQPINMTRFEEVYAAAVKVLPNNNILNIISKAGIEPYRETVLELFRTDKKSNFSYDDPNLKYLYMNGVIDYEQVDRTEYHTKFSCPFVQERLFNYFIKEIFPDVGKLHEPFEDLSKILTDTHLDTRNLLKRYQVYLKNNQEWLFKNAPRRSDMRIYEAVFHFNLFAYLDDFLESQGGKVFPEFPTGNGKIDLVIFYGEKRYGIEVKSYTDERNYKKAILQAASYGKKLRLKEIFLAFFVENIDDENRTKYEKDILDRESGVWVKPIFIEIAK